MTDIYRTADSSAPPASATDTALFSISASAAGTSSSDGGPAAASARGSRNPLEGLSPMKDAMSYETFALTLAGTISKEESSLAWEKRTQESLHKEQMEYRRETEKLYDDRKKQAAKEGQEYRQGLAKIRKEGERYLPILSKARAACMSAASEANKPE